MGQILMRIRSMVSDRSNSNRVKITTTAELTHEEMDTSNLATKSLKPSTSTSSSAVSGDQIPTHQCDAEIISTSTPMAQGPRKVHYADESDGADTSSAGAAPHIQADEIDPSNVSMASTSSNTSNYQDFTTNGEIDIAKIRAWTLPSAKRKTREWVNKQRKRGYVMNTKSSKLGHTGRGNSPEHYSPPSSLSPAKKLRKTRTEMKDTHQKKLQEMGFDVDSQYVKGLAHYNQMSHPNITNRRSSSDHAT